MNTLDLYEYDGSLSPRDNNDDGAEGSAVKANQPSLNEEVNQVIGQLGRFWGGFKKQVSLTSIRSVN